MTQQLLGNLKKGLVFVLSAPAGTGKTTLVKMLVEEFSCITQSISCTTRSPRAGEVDGRDYWFLSKQEFEERVEKEDFLEHAKVFGELYGTSRDLLQRQIDSSKHVFLVIDTQGARLLRKKGFEATYIFVAPPSLDVLAQRLKKRSTDSACSRKERLSWAEAEMQKVCEYDFLVVNDDLSIAYQVLKSIVIAEEHKIGRT